MSKSQREQRINDIAEEIEKKIDQASLWADDPSSVAFSILSMRIAELTVRLEELEAKQ